jgi:hypothetical protein
MNEIIELLQTESLTEILSGGYIDDDDEPKRSRLLLRCIYLAFGDRLLRCTSVGQFDQLKFDIVEHVDPTFSSDDLRIFQEYQFCLIPLTNLFVTEALSNHRVVGLRYFFDSRADPTRGIVTTAAMFLERGEVLFLDPRNTFGVHVGNKLAFEAWIRFNVVGTSTYREFTWPPLHS